MSAGLCEFCPFVRGCESCAFRGGESPEPPADSTDHPPDDSGAAD